MISLRAVCAAATVLATACAATPSTSDGPAAGPASTAVTTTTYEGVASGLSGSDEAFIRQLDLFFADQDRDLFTELLLATGNVGETVDGLIAAGHQNCQVLRNAYEDDAPSTVGAAWLLRSLHEENPEGEARDLDLALVASATAHLCPI